jgi:hypothetical protein
MVRRDTRLTFTPALFFVACFAMGGIVSLTGCSGCSLGGSGVSDYEKMVLDRKSAADALVAKGAKVELKKYPQGEANSINLAGATIDDEILDLIEAATPVSELLLSGSTVSDAHAARINSDKIGSYLLILDLSKTAFSDTGLAELKNLPLLMELNVTGSKVTSAAATNYKKTRSTSSHAFFKQLKLKM